MDKCKQARFFDKSSDIIAIGFKRNNHSTKMHNLEIDYLNPFENCLARFLKFGFAELGRLHVFQVTNG